MIMTLSTPRDKDLGAAPRQGMKTIMLKKAILAEKHYIEIIEGILSTLMVETPTRDIL